MFNDLEIREICKHFNIEYMDRGEVIDTSRGKDDIRLNYLINDKYFLKISNLDQLNESFFIDMNRLINHYHSIGVYCPALLKNKHQNYALRWRKENVDFVCYVEEKSKYPVRKNENEIDYSFKKEVLAHMGILASKYSNTNLSKTKSMWTINDMSSFNSVIDEKQENLDDLIRCLKKKGLTELASQLIEMNKHSRNRIQECLGVLPKCVYQGDLNNGNILVDEHDQFMGIIDFNMFGTEVNINCFLNEAMYYIRPDDFKFLSGGDVFTKTVNVQKDLLSAITKYYPLSSDELKILNDYNKIIFSSFYPNVKLMIECLDSHQNSNKIIDYLTEILK